MSRECKPTCHCCNSGSCGSNSSASSTSRMSSFCRSNRDSHIICNCGQRALRMTSNTNKNPGRTFYRCAFWNNEMSCGFFEWEDALPADSTISHDRRLINQLRRRNVAYQRQLKRLRLICCLLSVIVALFVLLFTIVIGKSGVRISGALLD